MAVCRYDIRGPPLKGAEKFSHPESHSKISNLTIAALFYSHILNMIRGTRLTGSFRRIHFSVLRYRLAKNAFAGPKSFRGSQIRLAASRVA